MSSSQQVPFSFRMDAQLKAQVEALCRATDRSKAYITSKALEEYVARHQWKAEAIQAAKAEVQQGVFFSHAAMQAWANTLGTEGTHDIEPDVFSLLP